MTLAGLERQGRTQDLVFVLMQLSKLKVHWFSQEGRSCAWGWGEDLKGRQDCARSVPVLQEDWITLFGGLFTKSWHNEQPSRWLKLEIEWSRVKPVPDP